MVWTTSSVITSGVTISSYWVSPATSVGRLEWGRREGSAPDDFELKESAIRLCHCWRRGSNLPTHFGLILSRSRFYAFGRATHLYSAEVALRSLIESGENTFLRMELGGKIVVSEQDWLSSYRLKGVIEEFVVLVEVLATPEEALTYG